MDTLSIMSGTANIRIDDELVLENDGAKIPESGKWLWSCARNWKLCSLLWSSVITGLQVPNDSKIQYNIGTKEIDVAYADHVQCVCAFR